MCCEQLVCAACRGRVVEAGCSTCRLSRAQVHPAPGFPLTADLMLILAALSALLLVLARAS